MYRTFAPSPYGPLQYPYGQLGELPAGIAQGACDIASNQGAKDAIATLDPKDGFAALVRAAPPGSSEMADAMLTCYMQGYNAEKAKQGVFYKTSQGKTGLVVGAIAGVVAGALIGKLLL